MADSAADDIVAEQDHDVALGNKDEDDHNTIVLTGVDVVVPVELDPDGDPFQDDQVNLHALHGFYDRTLVVTDPDVEADADARLLYYRFRLVPPGVYRVSVRTAGQWSPIIQRLAISKDGVFAGDTKLDDSLPDNDTAEEIDTVEDEDDDTSDDGGNDYCGH